MNENFEQQADAQIIRYLREQLSAEEKAQFEIRMLEEPELLERVQLLDALQSQLSAEEAKLFAHAQTPSANVIPFTAWLRQPLSLAASALLVGSLAFSLLRGPESALQGTGAIPLGSLILLDGTRGGDAIEVSGPGPYLLQIDAGLDAQASRFDVTVRNESTQEPFAEQTGLAPDGSGWLRLLIDDVAAGDYTVTVTGPDAQGAPQTREFRVRFGD